MPNVQIHADKWWLLLLVFGVGVNAGVVIDWYIKPVRLVDVSDDFNEAGSYLWQGYWTAELNVRYRDIAGDDGLKVDALYQEHSRIARQEKDVDVKIIRQVSQSMHKDLKEGKFPPKE